ncbi:MAG: alanine racemase [Fimbriimonadales bacterium]|nr:alanine racemase [Fimbriimonadales bacterium]
MFHTTNWLEVDESALQHNAQVIAAHIGAECTLWAVVKADAYGHGAVGVARALLQAGVSHFVVASLSEAIELREALAGQAFRVMTLYPPVCPEEWRAAAEYAVEGVIDSLAGYQQACAVAQSLGRSLPVHLEIDTGMSRLGLTPEQLGAFLEVFRADAPLRWQSVFTHFACADSDAEFTREQLRLFLQCVEVLRGRGLPPTPLHAAASAGLLTVPESRLDAVRIGLLLYGIAPSGIGAHPLCQQLRPALRWRARVISVRAIPKGQGVSYGARWRAERPTRVATLGVGYADGYPIGLTNRARIALHGRLVPQIGRVCMDMLMVDATDLPEVRVGDVATLIGSDGKAQVRVETLAQLLHTTPHELTTRLGSRAKRALHYAQ